MPRNDAYSQEVPYPVLGDAPDIEVATQAIVNGILPRTVMRFANANARSAALSGDAAPVPGMITYLIAEDRWDRRDGDGVWRPLSPGPWKPFTFSTGYSANSGGPAYRIVNNTVELRGTVRRSNNADMPTASETQFGTLPTEARPAGAYRYFVGATSFQTTSGVTYFSCRLGISPAGEMLFVVPLNAKVNWISLDGVRFSID